MAQGLTQISRMKIHCAVAAAAISLTAGFARADDKINYQEHVLPIFRNSCLTCHNPDKKKAGLDLSGLAVRGQWQQQRPGDQSRRPRRQPSVSRRDASGRSDDAA